ncbi:MAG: sigma factor-like helix-turn-helix DNA-binding protein [Thermodesulfobacteriota bacterium]
MLREVSGLKFREIAEMLEVGVPTVKSRMRYALKTLRGELAAYREHEFDAGEKLEMTP